MAVVAALIVVVALSVHLLPAAGHTDRSGDPQVDVTISSGPTTTPSTPLAPKPKPKPKPTSQERTDRQRAAGLRANGSTISVPARGSGRFRLAKQARHTSATQGPLLRFDVAVERGLDVDPDQAALLIARTLDDHRSWRGIGTGRFALVGAGKSADLHAYLATPKTTDRLCAPYQTLGKVSCQNGARVVLNAKRWVHGATAYGDDTTSYRRYLINHEFGHALGMPHAQCPGRGALAPVMMQQTKGLKTCRPNTWPLPTRG